VFDGFVRWLWKKQAATPAYENFRMIADIEADCELLNYSPVDDGVGPILMDECHRRVASPSPVCIVVIVEGGLDNERLQPLLMQIFGLLLRLMLIQIVDVLDGLGLPPSS